MKETNSEQRLTNTTVLNKKLDAAGWGLFYIWMGIALVANVSWGSGLLGVGIITLGGQVARKYLTHNVDGFWVVAGSFFLLGGIWESTNAQFGLIPILCIAVGLVLLVSTSARKASGCVSE